MAIYKKILIVSRPGTLQEGWSALIKEIPGTHIFNSAQWNKVENHIKTLTPDVIIVEAASLAVDDHIDVERLHSRKIRLVIIEDNPAFVEKWNLVGADLVMLVGELALTFYNNIQRLLDEKEKRVHADDFS